MKDNKKTIIIIAIIGILVFAITFIGLKLTKNIGKTSDEITKEEGMKSLSSLLNKINVKEVEARKANVDLTSENLADELPDIDTSYPLTVTGNGEINIEIFSSPEKAGSGTDGWLNEVAKKFNNENYQLNGKKVTVSVRSIASGTAIDYITSGKYIPDAYTPSNELWGEMLKAQNVEVEEVSNKLVGNVAGIMIEKSKYDDFIKKYGTVNMETIIQATTNNEIAMGYTNPFSSSTGLNFLITTLTAFDGQNPLSETAISGFQAFQENVPFVSYTTMQMREAAETGSLDAFILEYQTYQNDTKLKNYVFTPFGVRHDNPLYSVGNLSEEKKQALKTFTEYALNETSQKLATNYGFNGLDTYVSEVPVVNGSTIIDAQGLWKEEKDSGRPVVAVFVADISGSMAGEPINQLKKSLINASQYIDSRNYIGLVSYNSNVFINLPIRKFDLNQRAYFTGAVEDLEATGGTATFNAITVALNMLMEQKEQIPDAKLMLFVLSDGETNNGYSLENIKGVLESLEIPVYTIGYNANISALETISSINEAASINADSEDVVYQLRNLFNSQM